MIETTVEVKKKNLITIKLTKTRTHTQKGRNLFIKMMYEVDQNDKDDD